MNTMHENMEFYVYEEMSLKCGPLDELNDSSSYMPGIFAGECGYGCGN